MNVKAAMAIYLAEASCWRIVPKQRSIMVFIIVLESRRFLIVHNEAWIEKPVPGCFSRYFFSPNENALPDFTTKNKYLFDNQQEGWYNCFVNRVFGKNTSHVNKCSRTSNIFLFYCYSDDVSAAENFVGKLRPIYPIQKTKNNCPMEIIELSDDDLDTSKRSICSA